MAKRPGVIVNIASILGLRTIGQVAPYNASKAGLIHLTRALAMEWARHDIRVNAICPGYIETEMNSDFWKTPAGQRLIDRIPQRRIGKPEHLDGALLLAVVGGGQLHDRQRAHGGWRAHGEFAPAPRPRGLQAVTPLSASDERAWRPRAPMNHHPLMRS